MTAPRRKTLRAAIIAICVAAATAGCATRDAEVTTSSSASNTSVAAPGSPSSRRSKYADGTYNATGQYGSLPSSIGVSVTLVEGVITAVRVTPHATDPTYQVDAAYRGQYRRYGQRTIGGVVNPGARAATIKLVPR
jgi:uncharacterized protein with FMN-binding domain